MSLVTHVLRYKHCHLTIGQFVLCIIQHVSSQIGHLIRSESVPFKSYLNLEFSKHVVFHFADCFNEHCRSLCRQRVLIQLKEYKMAEERLVSLT